MAHDSLYALVCSRAIKNENKYRKPTAKFEATALKGTVKRDLHHLEHFFS